MSSVPTEVLAPRVVTSDELSLIKTTVAVGATDAELKLFLFDCARQGVHPAPASGLPPVEAERGRHSDSRPSGAEVLEGAARPSGTSEWWVRLRWKSGYEATYPEKSALNRGLLIIATAGRADVMAQGER